MRFEEVPLRRVVRMVNGGTPTSEAENWGGDIAWATPVDVGQNHGGELHGTARTITEDGLRSGSAIVPAGSVLVSSRAPIGYVAQAAVPMAFNQGCKGLIPRELVAARFLAYALQHIGPAMAAAGTGTTFQEISGGALAALAIPLPNTDEQRAIADFLDRETAQIDAMVDAQERLVSLLEERRLGVVLNYLTAPPTSGPVSGIPWAPTIPSGWAALPVRRVASVTLGKMLQSEPKTVSDVELRYLRAANVQPNGRLALDDVKTMWFTEQEASTLTIEEGDVVVVEGGIGGFGRSAYCARSLPGVAFQNSINRLRPNPGNDGRFLNYMLMYSRALGYIRAFSNVVSMPHFTADKVLEYKLPIAPPPVQLAVADRLDSATARIGAMIAKAQQSIALMKERRAAVISAAVTGRIDVRTGIEQVERDLEEARV